MYVFTFPFVLIQKKSNKRKNQGCTFLPTPVLFYTKQKELASLKQLFVFNAPKSTSASRQKSEAGPVRFSITLLRSLGVYVLLALKRLFPTSVEEREEIFSLFREEEKAV